MKIKNYLIFALVSFFVFFGYNSAEQNLTTFYESRGILGVATKALSLLYGVIIVGCFFSPSITNKIGIKRTTLIGLSMYTLFVFTLSLKIPVLAYIAALMLGVGCGLSGIAGVDFIRLESPKGKVGEVSGILNAFRTLGGFIGILTASYLLSRNIAFESIYTFLGLVMLIGITILVLFLKEPARERVETERKETSLLESFKLLKDKRVHLIFPYQAGNGFLFGLILGAIPKMISTYSGLQYVGVVTSLFYLTLSISGYFTGKLSDKFGRYKMLFLSVVTSVVTVLILMNFKSLLMLTLSMIFAGFSSSINGVVLGALNIDIFKEHIKEASVALSILSTLFGFIPALILSKNLSSSTMYFISLAITIIGFITINLLRIRESRVSAGN